MLKAVLLCSLMTIVAAELAAQPPSLSADGAKSPLKVTVKTDKPSYAPSDHIQITVTLTNPTKHDVATTYATGQKFDVFMYSAPAGKKPPEQLWQWSIGMMFTQMVTTTTLGAGKSVTYTVKFPPEDSMVKLPTLTKGTYTIKAVITTMGGAPKPEATFKFRVK